MNVVVEKAPMAVPSSAEAIEHCFSRSDGRFDICAASGQSQEISLKGQLSSSVDLKEGFLLLFQLGVIALSGNVCC